MADVFLSYAAEDRDRVAPLVDFLESRGWSVWWDRSLRPGETWPEVIERELNRARCIVVAWSQRSVVSPWVRLEANRARERRNIVPVLLDAVAVPAEFATFQSFDMCGTPTESALGQLGDGVAGQLRKRRSRRVAMSGGVLAVALIGLVATTCISSDRCGSWRMSSDIPDTSFAVLATDMTTADNATRALLDAFVDDIRRNLRRTGIGKVSSRAETSAVPASTSPIDIGERLRVRWLVALTIGATDDGFRVLVELIDTTTGYLSDDWSLTGSPSGLGTLNATLVRNVVSHFVADLGAVPTVVSEPNDAYALYLQGKAALREGSDESQIKIAESLFMDLLERWPGYGLAEAGLCQLHLLRYERTRARGSLATGEQHCSRALAIDPESADAAIALGELYLHEGRYAQAREAFTRAVAESGTLADGHMGLGRVALAEGQTDDAEREFRAAVEAEPGYWRTYTTLGNFLFEAGRGDEAAAEHRKAATLAQHDGVALNNLGAALFLSGQIESAIGAWQSAVALAHQAPTYSNLGAAYYLLGNFDDAVTMYERSVALSSTDYRTWSNLGDARTWAGRADATEAYERSAALIAQQLDTNPNDALARAGLAAVHAALGAREDATRELELAGTHATAGDWQFHYVAAITEARLGAMDAARTHIQAAIAAGYPKALVDIDPGLRAVRPLS